MARKENALISWMPQKLRNRIKALLQGMNSLVTPQLIVNPSLAGKLYAYRPFSNEFVVYGPSAAVERDANGVPIPPREIRLGQSTAEFFTRSGQEDIDQMVRGLAAVGLSLERFERILEFGCSSGRMIRRLYELAKTHEVWGVDLAAEHIFWCQQNLSPPLHFATVTTTPHLPFEDRYFDFIYAGSVFTHIDDMVDAWYLELRRILKPGGYAYITVHGDDTMRFVEENRDRDPWCGMVAGCKAYEEFKRNKAKMFTVGRSMMAYVFFDTDYLVRHLSRMYEVTSVINKAYRNFQTGLLLRKRPET